MNTVSQSVAQFLPNQLPSLPALPVLPATPDVLRFAKRAAPVTLVALGALVILVALVRRKREVRALDLLSPTQACYRAFSRLETQQFIKDAADRLKMGEICQIMLTNHRADFDVQFAQRSGKRDERACATLLMGNKSVELWKRNSYQLSQYQINACQGLRNRLNAAILG